MLQFCDNGKNPPEDIDDEGVFPEDAFPTDAFPEDVFPPDVFPRPLGDENGDG